VFHDESKNIEIRYHFTGDMMQRGTIKLQYLSQLNRIADVLTNPLSCVKFEHF
jgi:hypothetical protein